MAARRGQSLRDSPGSGGAVPGSPEHRAAAAIATSLIYSFVYWKLKRKALDVDDASCLVALVELWTGTMGRGISNNKIQSGVTVRQWTEFISTLSFQLY